MVTYDKETAETAYIAAANTLGGKAEMAKHAFAREWQSGEGPRRFYHTPQHFIDVAGAPEPGNPIGSARFLAGFHHDAIYAHVDVKDALSPGISPEISEKLQRFGSLEISTKGEVNLHLSSTETLSPEQTALFKAANLLFAKNPESGVLRLNPYSSAQNEYLSALYAIAEGLDQGIAPKYLLAEIAMIEATIPFRPANHLPELQDKLEAANTQLAVTLGSQSRLNAEEISHTMKMAEQVANADIANFAFKFDDFFTNTANVLLEMTDGPADPHKALVNTMSPLALALSMRNMQTFMQRVLDGGGHIFHERDPAKNMVAEQESTARENIGKLITRLANANTNLQLLTNDYKTHHGGQEAPDFESLFRHVQTQYAKIADDKPSQSDQEKAANIKYSALQLLSLIGSDVLTELAVSLPGDPASLKAYLRYLHMRAKEVTADRRDGDTDPVGMPGDEAPAFSHVAQKKTPPPEQPETRIDTSELEQGLMDLPPAFSRVSAPASFNG